MKNLNLLIYLLFVIFCSCSDSESVSGSDSDLDTDVLSEVSKGYLQAKIDGELFYKEFESTKFNSNGGVITYTNKEDGTGLLAIGAEEVSVKQSFRMFIEDVKEGEFLIRGGVTKTDFFYSEKETGNIFTTGSNSEEINGKIIITKFDLKSKVIEGAFYAEFKKNDSALSNNSESETLKITEGKFSGSFLTN